MQYLLLLGLVAAPALTLPTDTYPAPPGGWESIDYPDGTGENLGYYPPPPGGWESIDYPEGTGENLEHYPAPPGGWESVDYSGGGSKPDDKSCPPAPWMPLSFTSTYHIVATPGEVVNGTNPAVATGGLKGCTGYFDIGINSKSDMICWNITLTGFQGEYSSPADTATHIHQGARGSSGPPRIIFPDPVGDGHEKVSVGCKYGPFLTGVVTDGKDAGEGFTLKQIEADAAGFYADVHSSLAVPGAVRGQLA